MKRAASSAFAAEDMTNLIILAMVRTGLLKAGAGVSSDRNMWAPARLRDLDPLRKPASVWPASSISLWRGM